MKFLALLTLTLLLHAPAVHAVELWTWRPYQQLPPILVATFANESPLFAAQRYLHGLSSDPGLRALLQRDALPELPLRNFKRLDDRDFSNRRLLITNRPADFQSFGNWRIESFATPLLIKQQQPYLLPFALDEGLTIAQVEDLVLELDRRFPSMVAMGGDDLALELVGLPTEGSLFTCARRDAFEMKVLLQKIYTIEHNTQTWMPDFLNHAGVARQDGLLGICRGAQFIAALMGWRIQTHIDNHGGHSERPLVDEGNAGAQLITTNKSERIHPIQLIESASGVLAGILGRLKNSRWANSYHHQCAIPVANDRLHLAVVDPTDGCAEGYESSNGRIVGVQWHPELMAVRSLGELKALGLQVTLELIEHLAPVTDCQTDLSAGGAR